jgi:hypothetical protein
VVVEPRAHKPPRRNFRRYFVITAIISFLAVVLITLIGLAYLLDGALRVKAAMDQGETAIEVADFSAASDALEDAILGLKEMKSGFPFLSYLKPVPWVGDQLSGAEVAIDASLETLEVIVTGLQVARDVLDTASGADGVVVGVDGSTETRPYSDLTDEEQRLLLTGLAASLPDLREMQVRLRLAQADIERLDDYKLAPALEGAIEPLKQLIPELLTSVDVLVPFAAIAPEYGGLNSDRQFLVLFLNDTELRPGGGFIGVYGLMVIRDGQIENMVTGDSYHIDQYVQGKEGYHVNPPPPLVSYLTQPVWFFRDAAWSPDFAQTAKDAAQLMRQEVAFGGQPVPEIHGVVGITPTFISRLLTFVGPVTVEGQTFTSDNIADLLEYQVEQGFAENGVPLEQRKEIVSTLTNELVDRLLALPPSAWPSLFRILHDGFDEKEFALMSYDEKTQAALEDNGWAGVLNSAAADDVLLTVDANMAALKTDRVVDRHVTYTVVPYGAGYRATASITYDHNGWFDWKTTRYRTYTRVYAPLGSRLVSASGTMKDDKTRNPGLLPGEVTVADEAGMTSFGAFIAIEPGQTGTLSFTYDLPLSVANAIDRGTYRLLTLKQLGAGDNLLTLNLDFGNTLTAADPGEEPEYFGDNLYQVTTELNTDKLFTVRVD